MTSPIRPDDFELLSAYLDNALPEAARADLESRLATEPELRATLDSLRTTIRVLRAAPSLKTPRNFTLDPVRYRRVAWWASYRTMQVVGALGAFASVVLIVLGLFTSTMSFQSAPAASSGAIAVLPTSAAVTQNSRLESTPTLGQRASDKAAMPATETNAMLSQEAASTSQAVPTTTPLVTIQTLPPTVAAAPLLAATNAAPPSAADETAAGLSAPQPSEQTPLAEGYRPTTGVMAGAAAAQAPTATRPASKSQAESGQNAQSAGPEQPAQLVPPATQQLQPIMPQATALPSATETGTPSPAPTATLVPPTASPQSTTVVAVGATATGPGEQGGAGGKVESATSPSATLTASLRDNKDDNVRRQTTQPFAAPAYFLIVGIALFVFSTMLFGVGWLRSRL
jgi:hypothetical protein